MAGSTAGIAGAMSSAGGKMAAGAAGMKVMGASGAAGIGGLAAGQREKNWGGATQRLKDKLNIKS